MSFTLVSAYTQHTPYEEEFKRFDASVKKQGITNYKVYPLQSKGNWYKNCQLKATTILNAMNELNDNILWVDIDAEIRGDISYFNTLDCDICCYYLKTRWNPNELLSGTIYFANNEASKRILSKWIEINAGNSSWDQINLQSVVDKENVRKTIMPADYIVVDRICTQWQKYGSIKIYHHQASRKNRNSKLL